jgi:hypothetical protein
MAFDSHNFVRSTGFNSNGFTDYKGLSMTSDAQNTTSNMLPDLGTASTSAINQFGSYGILLYGAGIIAANSQIPATITQQDYTIDYWFRNTTYPNDVSLEIVPFSWYNVMQQNNNKWCMWGNFKDGLGPRFQVSTTANTRPKSLYTGMYNNTNWNHFGYTFVKSTNTHYLFVNGNLIDSFVLEVPSPGTLGNKFGIAGHVNSAGTTGGTAPHTAIDRFRVRNTAVWTASFNLSTLYPS